MKNLFKTSIVFLTISFTINSVSLAANQCGALFDGIYKTEPTLAELVHEFRMSKVLKPSKMTNQTIDVNGTSYTVIGILGRGTAVVYLAKDPQGELVSIKIITASANDSSWANTAMYEIAASQFYKEQGEIVPGVLNYQLFRSSPSRLKKAILVKEYIEGINFDDFNYLMYRRPGKWIKYYDLREQMQPELRRLGALHKEKFRKWLSENNIDLGKYHFNTIYSRFDRPDNADRNFLFSPKHNKWILFDP